MPNKTITLNEKTIQVKSYLPISDKMDVVQITIQKADNGRYIDQLALDMFFELNLVYSYSNIEVTQEDRDDQFALYDRWTQDGTINAVISAIPDEEYNKLSEAIDETVEDLMRYRGTAAAVVNSFIQDLPRNAEIAKEIVDSFDPEKYKEVVEFAKAANGGRSITG